MKKLLIVLVTVRTVGCATLPEDVMTIALSFSDGSSGECQLINKRGAWMARVPTTIPIRKSDDALKFHCETKDGRVTVGSIPSDMGGKNIAGAALIDDAITDIHRRYPPGFTGFTAGFTVYTSLTCMTPSAEAMASMIFAVGSDSMSMML